MSSMFETDYIVSSPIANIGLRILHLQGLNWFNIDEENNDMPSNRQI